MALKSSTGLRNKLLDTGSLKSIFNLGFIKIYAGTAPASADDSLGAATLLCTISVNSTGTGITFAASASNGTLVKNSGEAWSGVNVANGTAAFYRLVAPDDTGASSTTEARIQGTCGTSGADLNLTNVALVSGAAQTVDYYSVSLPTA
jgi:hypothetical protein